MGTDMVALRRVASRSGKRHLCLPAHCDHARPNHRTRDAIVTSNGIVHLGRNFCVSQGFPHWELFLPRCAFFSAQTFSRASFRSISFPFIRAATLYDENLARPRKINSAGVVFSDNTIFFHVLSGNETRWNQLWAANYTHTWFVSDTPEVFYYDEAYDFSNLLLFLSVRFICGHISSLSYCTSIIFSVFLKKSMVSPHRSLAVYNGEVYFAKRYPDAPSSTVALAATNGFVTRASSLRCPFSAHFLLVVSQLENRNHPQFYD
jgi:hypothetical protein